MKMKNLHIVGIITFLIIGMIVLSGCTNSDDSSSSSTPTATQVTVRTLETTPAPTLNPTSWDGCRCTVIFSDTVQKPYIGVLKCQFSQGSEYVRGFSDVEKGIDKPYPGQESCTYNGGKTCTCTEASTYKYTKGTCSCTPEICTNIAGSTRTCTRGTCTCFPGNSTYEGGGTCTCTPDSCTCTNRDSCTCTNPPGPPNRHIDGSCICYEAACDCTR